MASSRTGIYNHKYSKLHGISENNDNNYGAIDIEQGEYHIPAFAHNSKLSDGGFMQMEETSGLIRRKKAMSSGSVDDFAVDLSTQTSNLHKALRSGRQRKKNAARSKGGEFQAKRKKRRIYFCSISSAFDVEKLADKFSTPQLGLRGKMYDEVLHLYMDQVNELAIPLDELYRNNSVEADSVYDTDVGNDLVTDDESPRARRESGGKVRRRASFDEISNAYSGVYHDDGTVAVVSKERNSLSSAIDAATKAAREVTTVQNIELQSTAAFWNYGGREVFVFDFGALVFWGYQREEVSELIDLIRGDYINKKDELSAEEFEQGEDDMAFVTSLEVDAITIANDVITLPDVASVKSRLAVSFAIAQSSVLSIFESRVESKVEQYKYIPEELAEHGKVKLPPKQLANMIGEVFVIRHDVNLHSEILNIPDYFWKEYAVEPIYRMTMNYLEMEPRTEVLNTRLNILGELLRVLQQQHENAHNVKLEWIIIWLILVSAILELWMIIVDVMALLVAKKVAAHVE